MNWKLPSERRTYTPARTARLSRTRSRASNEYNCPNESVVVEDLGGAAYRVQACGNAVTYVCKSSAERTSVHNDRGNSSEIGRVSANSRRRLLDARGYLSRIALFLDVEGNPSTQASLLQQTYTPRDPPSTILFEPASSSSQH